MKYQDYIAQAMGAQFSGWDFSYLIDSGRLEEDDLHWSYEKIVKEYFRDSKTLLDMGTGGGEKLSCLAPLPETVFATESYEPNLETAKKRLAPLGVNVVYIPENPEPPYNDSLPFENGFFDLIINRHEAYYPAEIRRILKNGRYFITQQMGALSLCNLVLDLLGDSAVFSHWNLMSAVTELEDAGFKIHKKREQLVPVRFYDIGAVVYYLKNIPWTIPGFDPDKYEHMLRFIGSVIDSRGFYQSIYHCFLIIAQNV